MPVKVGEARSALVAIAVDMASNISTAIATKADLASPTFTGTVTIPALTFTGTLSTGTIDGGTY